MANDMEKIKVELPDPELVSLADKIVQVIEKGKQALAISINETIKTTYWKIGRHIVELEQEGNRRAKFATSICQTSDKSAPIFQTSEKSESTHLTASE